MARWHGLKREERVCKECDSGEVEDVCHWLLQCSAWKSLWQPLLEAMGNVEEGDEDRTALILSHACRNYHILSIISSMWSARFKNLSLTLSLLTLVSLCFTQLYLFL